MTKDEHKAALEMGLRLERGMTVWSEADEDAPEGTRWLVEEDQGAVCGTPIARCVLDNGDPFDRLYTLTTDGLAPDLTDPATYRAAYEQCAVRLAEAGNERGIVVLGTQVAGMACQATAADRVALSALLRETAAQTAPAGGEGEAAP